MNRLYLDLALLGRYPDELPEIFGDAWPADAAADLAASVRRQLDFLGINYYTRGVMRDDPAAVPYRAGRVHQDGAPHTDIGWEVFPQGLHRLPRLGQGALRRPAALRHRERRRLPRPAGRRRA